MVTRLISKFWVYIELIAIARTATELSRSGKYKEASALYR